MKVYGTSYGLEIKEKEITRTSDKNIFFINDRGREEREMIKSTFRQWHNSRQEAIDFLLDRTQYAIKCRKEQVKRLEEDLKIILTLK